MQRMERGGSILGFIIICLVGAVLLVGGVYALHHVSWFKTDSTPAAVSAPDDANGSNSSTKSSPATTNKPHSSTPKDKAATGDQSSSTSGDQTTPADSSAAPSTSPETTSSAPVPSSSALPHTGPSDVLATVIALGALTAAALSYTRSRRMA